MEVKPKYTDKLKPGNICKYNAYDGMMPSYHNKKCEVIEVFKKPSTTISVRFLRENGIKWIEKYELYPIIQRSISKPGQPTEIDPYGEEMWNEVEYETLTLKKSFISKFKDFFKENTKDHDMWINSKFNENVTIFNENKCREIWNFMKKEDRINFIKINFPRIRKDDIEMIADKSYGTLDYYLMSNKRVINKKLMKKN